MGSKWDEIRLVTSTAELESIYRFRYSVYVEEMGRVQADADHARKRIEDKLDSAGYNLAAFCGNEVVGAVRVSLPREQRIDFYEDFLEMPRFGNAHPERTCVVTRLMVHPRYRRGMLTVRLAEACFALSLARGVSTAFIDCNDHVVEFFARLGFEDYVGKKRHPEYGLVTPMVLRMLDLQRLEAIASPFARLLVKPPTSSPLPLLEPIS